MRPTVRYSHQRPQQRAEQRAPMSAVIPSRPEARFVSTNKAHENKAHGVGALVRKDGFALSLQPTHTPPPGSTRSNPTQSHHFALTQR